MTQTPPGMPPARVLWIIAGLSFFVAGVVFTFVTPDNFALGITFLGLGVVFFSLSSTLAGVGARGSDDSTGDEPEEGDSPLQPPPSPRD